MKTNYFRLVWTIVCMHFKQMVVDGFVIVVIFINPLIMAILAIFMLRGSEDFQLLNVMIGSGLTGLWAGTIFCSSIGIEFERWTGTLEMIIGSPTDLFMIVLGKSIATGMISVGSTILYYPLAAFLFNMNITINHPLLFFLSLPIAVASILSLGLIFAPLFALNPGKTLWTNAFEYLIYAFGGFLFPVILFPEWIRPFSYILAPYWASRLLHLSASSSFAPREVILCFGILILLLVGNYLIAKWLFRIVLRSARVEATISMQ